jgi:signal transduction histidine kinase
MTKPTIMVVDDDSGTRETLSDILADWDYQVFTFARGDVAVKAFIQSPVDVLLIDIGLPDMSGLEVLQQVRENKPDVAVVIMTGYAALENAVQAINRGASAYIVKPINVEALKAILKKALREVRLSQENERLIDRLQLTNRNLDVAKKKLETTNRDLEVLTLEMREAKEKIQESANIKSEFTSMVSHELRTPLTIIKGSIDLVLGGIDGPVNPKQVKHLEMAKRNIDRLARLINDVLDFQKLEVGRMEFELLSLDMNELAHKLVDEFIVPAKKKGLEIKGEFSEHLPLARGDIDKVSQVLVNFINNAIKFSERGQITVATQRLENGVQIEVRDQGLGIKKEDLPKLFQSFSQLTTGGSRSTGGTGLGLAIAKKIIEGQGGKIGVESVCGQGSTFWFTLPLNGKENSHS